MLRTLVAKSSVTTNSIDLFSKLYSEHEAFKKLMLAAFSDQPTTTEDKKSETNSSEKFEIMPRLKIAELNFKSNDVGARRAAKKEFLDILYLLHTHQHAEYTKDTEENHQLYLLLYIKVTMLHLEAALLLPEFAADDHSQLYSLVIKNLDAMRENYIQQYQLSSSSMAAQVNTERKRIIFTYLSRYSSILETFDRELTTQISQMNAYVPELRKVGKKRNDLLRLNDMQNDVFKQYVNVSFPEKDEKKSIQLPLSDAQGEAEKQLAACIAVRIKNTKEDSAPAIKLFDEAFVYIYRQLAQFPDDEKLIILFVKIAIHRFEAKLPDLSLDCKELILQLDEVRNRYVIRTQNNSNQIHVEMILAIGEKIIFPHYSTQLPLLSFLKTQVDNVLRNLEISQKFYPNGRTQFKIFGEKLKPLLNKLVDAIAELNFPESTIAPVNTPQPTKKKVRNRRKTTTQSTQNSSQQDVPQPIEPSMAAVSDSSERTAVSHQPLESDAKSTPAGSTISIEPATPAPVQNATTTILSLLNQANQSTAASDEKQETKQTRKELPNPASLGSERIPGILHVDTRSPTHSEVRLPRRRVQFARTPSAGSTSRFQAPKTRTTTVDSKLAAMEQRLTQKMEQLSAGLAALSPQSPQACTNTAISPLFSPYYMSPATPILQPHFDLSMTPTYYYVGPTTVMSPQQAPVPAQVSPGYQLPVNYSMGRFFAQPHGGAVAGNQTPNGPHFFF